MTFNKNISGKYYTALDGEVYLYRQLPNGRFGGVAKQTDITSTKETVAATGWQTVAGDGSTMVQLVSGYWIDLAEGWQTTGESVQFSRQQAQALVSAIIENNKAIISNNLLCARFADKLTAEQKRSLYELQQRLSERNNSLLQDGLVTPQTTGTPAGYAAFESYLDRFMQSGGVGSVTVALVIAAVVVASLSTAAYFAYRYYYDQSEQDVKFSNDLTKTLCAKLTEAEYQQLMEETQGLVTKAKLKQRLSIGARWLGIAAVGLIAAGLIYKYVKK